MRLRVPRTTRGSLLTTPLLTTPLLTAGALRGAQHGGGAHTPAAGEWRKSAVQGVHLRSVGHLLLAPLLTSAPSGYRTRSVSSSKAPWAATRPPSPSSPRTTSASSSRTRARAAAAGAGCRVACEDHGEDSSSKVPVVLGCCVLAGSGAGRPGVERDAAVGHDDLDAR